MKEMTRKEFLKLTGASTALLAMSHIIPTSAYADTSKIDAPSAGMYISEVVDLSGLSPVEQEKILTERNIPYDSTITYEKIVVERPAARDSYKGVPYRFQITYGNKPVKNERRSVVSPAAAAVLDRGVNILIGLTKPYIWIRGLRRTADCHLSEQCWIPCPLWKVLASGQLARNGRQPDLHGRSPLRRCPLRIDARTPDHPAGGV